MGDGPEVGTQLLSPFGLLYLSSLHDFLHFHYNKLVVKKLQCCDGISIILLIGDFCTDSLAFAPGVSSTDTGSSWSGWSALVCPVWFREAINADHQPQLNGQRVFSRPFQHGCTRKWMDSRTKQAQDPFHTPFTQDNCALIQQEIYIQIPWWLSFGQYFADQCQVFDVTYNKQTCVGLPRAQSDPIYWGPQKWEKCISDIFFVPGPEQSSG